MKQFIPIVAKTLLLGLFMIWLGLFFCGRLNLPAADLGRHIKNGEVFVKEGHIVDTNYYSYTETDRPTITHHWGVGVIFYYIWKKIGFTGLGFSYAGLSILTFLLLFFQAKKLSNFRIAYGISVLSLPLIVSRLEIRPEGFSYLFLALFLYLLCRYRENASKSKALWLLLPVQLLWVNIHIFFILGPFFVACFLCDAIYHGEKSQKVKHLTLILLACIGVSLINPFGLNGVLAPLTIFKEYGYKLAENQTLFFMVKRFPENLFYKYAFASLGLTYLLMFFSFNRVKSNFKFYPYVMMAFFSILAISANRGASMFGWLLIPFGAYFCHQLIKRYISKHHEIVSTLIFGIALIGVCLGLLTNHSLFSPRERLTASFVAQKLTLNKFWIDDALKHFVELPGLYPGNQTAAKSFNHFKIEGPVFNNYDIGGYLIFHLYPRLKVFVDNRPEAYSNDFFKKTYVPMQEEEAVWEKKDKHYKFNAIFFYRQDITPWAQPFLIKRLKDPKWAAVYVDYYSIIFLKRNAKNAAIIRRYELPSTMFRFEQGSSK